jgi:hypothetical protein
LVFYEGITFVEIGADWLVYGRMLGRGKGDRLLFSVEMTDLVVAPGEL